jgi:hypothetical protein
MVPTVFRHHVFVNPNGGPASKVCKGDNKHGRPLRPIGLNVCVVLAPY